jgi:hypothetical protein
MNLYIIYLNLIYYILFIKVLFDNFFEYIFIIIVIYYRYINCIFNDFIAIFFPHYLQQKTLSLAEILFKRYNSFTSQLFSYLL